MKLWQAISVGIVGGVIFGTLVAIVVTSIMQ